VQDFVREEKCILEFLLVMEIKRAKSLSDVHEKK
jgi:hypothetical protein